MPVLDSVKDDLSDIVPTPEERVALAAQLQKMLPPELTVRVKFMYRDLRDTMDQVHRRYVGYPTRIRLEGMIRDLDEKEKLAMAHFEASVEILNRLGVLDRAKLEGVMPAPFTAGHEVLDEGVVGHTFTPQK